MNYDFDFLIIGPGMAGLSFALKVADEHKIAIINKSNRENCNTKMAQGGIAAVFSQEDSFDSHIEDTLSAGAGLSNLKIVKQIVETAPLRINDLIDWGVNFDKVDNNEELDLCREAAHSHHRVLHIKDSTGKAVHQVLIEKCNSHPNIQFFDNCCAIDLISKKTLKQLPDGESNKCFGAYIFNRTTNKVFSIRASHTVLATGGAGKIYQFTSNWEGATGDGIAMAARAGCRVSNLEFMQFHPTCLYHPKANNFLITEAIRGDGAILVNSKGEEFMNRVHPLGSLAPRDVVARQIDLELKTSGEECVYLKLKNNSFEYLESKFPSILFKCKELGIDITKENIPVVPAAHYLCGGVLTNLNGETDISNLLAIGETACTGLHGANRLASNSLLECIVTAHNAANLCLKKFDQNYMKIEIPEWKYSYNTDDDEMIVINHIWDEIRILMWNYVGIVRSTKRLKRAQQRLCHLINEINEYYWDFQIHRDILELRNIALVAKLSVDCALQRKESRGIHYMIDFPQLSENAENTII